MHHLSKAMKRREIEVFHATARMHANIHGAKIQSLDELDGVESSSEFDEQTDKKFEEQALKRLREAQAKHG